MPAKLAYQENHRPFLKPPTKNQILPVLRFASYSRHCMNFNKPFGFAMNVSLMISPALWSQPAGYFGFSEERQPEITKRLSLSICIKFFKETDKFVGL